MRDALAQLHWEAIVQQHIDPKSEKTREAIRRFNEALDVQLGALFDPCLEGCKPPKPTSSSS